MFGLCLDCHRNVFNSAPWSLFFFFYNPDYSSPANTIPVYFSWPDKSRGLPWWRVGGEQIYTNSLSSARCGCFVLYYSSLQYLTLIHWPNNVEYVHIMLYRICLYNNSTAKILLHFISCGCFSMKASRFCLWRWKLLMCCSSSRKRIRRMSEAQTGT